ncbi:ferrochelatase [Acidobacteria bacterium Mor1]|nr:ferrochelatase [Acidobacteria bacterium Mor1]
MLHPEKTGLLLLNLGTPESPAPSDVRPYLRQFLSDPRVLDIPGWKRWLILNLFILPFRPKESGEAYEKVWTDEGSPLLVYGRQLTNKVQERLGEEIVVDLAMRYGEPSIPGTLRRMREQGVDRIVVFPLYPQYSSAATGSSLEEVFREAGKLWNTPWIQVVPPFYHEDVYLDVQARVARPHLEEIDPEVVFFSFHGLPERHMRKSDETGRHCLETPGCCEKIVEANRNCYSAQCYHTAGKLADKLGIPMEKRVICFQSRLGRDPWIKPYTDELIVEHAKAGKKRAVILSPAFVADCLETLEELAMRGREDWEEHGGELFRLVPSVNAEDDWADAVVELAVRTTGFLKPAAESADEPSAAANH